MAAKAVAKVIPAVPKGAAVNLFQFNVCPYCCKIKSLLRAQNTPYSTVEVMAIPGMKRQIEWSDYQKVPIAVFSDGAVVNDSGAIIDTLLQRTPIDDENFYSAEAKQWGDWATDKLAVMMYPNMTRNYFESRNMLAYTKHVPGFTLWEKFLLLNIGPLGMKMGHKKILKKYNITDEREALREVLDEWDAELKKSAGAFRIEGRATPDFGDVAVYGILTACQGLSLWDEIAAHGDGTIGEWMQAVDQALPAPMLVEAN